MSVSFTIDRYRYQGTKYQERKPYDNQGIPHRLFASLWGTPLWQGLLHP